jgi:hypothetical protein
MQEVRPTAGDGVEEEAPPLSCQSRRAMDPHHPDPVAACAILGWDAMGLVNPDTSEEWEEDGDDYRLDLPAARARTSLPELPTEEHICNPMELPKSEGAAGTGGNGPRRRVGRPQSGGVVAEGRGRRRTGAVAADLRQRRVGFMKKNKGMNHYNIISGRWVIL